MKLTPAVMEQLRLRAEAEMHRRQRAGDWAGSVSAHTEYAGRPVAWMVDKLGMPESHIRWSLNPEYQCCHCPHCVKMGNAGQPHLWDGDPDPLVKALDAIFKGESVAVSSGTTTGKAQPVDEPVLTPDGWRPIGDLRPGDLVVGSDGRPTEVLAVYPQGVLPVFSISFSDGASTRACAEHLWAVRNKYDTYEGKPWRIMTTADMARMNFASDSWRVPLPQPIDYPHADLPIDPYTLGILLGDGSYTKSTPRLHTADKEVLAAVAAATGLDIVRADDRYCYNILDTSAPRNAPNPLMVALRGLGVAGRRAPTKRVPAVYMRASAPQRLAMLQGLLDSDGTVRRGHPAFSSVSAGLADDVVALARSLGGVATVASEKSFLNGVRHRDSYRVHIRLPAETEPFRLPRKLARVKRAHSLARMVSAVGPAGEAECVCIRVAAADSLYVTKDFVVTHNTYTLGAAGTLAFLAIHPRSIVFSLAPKQDLLLKNMWKNIGELWPRFKTHFPNAQILSGNLRMLDGDGQQELWTATAFGAGVGAAEELSSRLKGFHHPTMLWIVEEMQGVDPAHVETIVKTSSSEFNPIMGLGNPNDQHDQLARFGKRDWVRPIRISAIDFPNVVCGRVVVPGGRSRASIERDLADADGDETHPHYLSQVRGIAPAQSRHALIRWEWLEAAAARFSDPALRNGPLALGIDVADSPTGDKSAFSRWQGACCTEVVSFRAEDASEVGRIAFREIMDPENPINPRYVGVDAVGVGASCKNELKRLGVRVRTIYGGGRTAPGVDVEGAWQETRKDEDGRLKPANPMVTEAEQYANTRAAVLWRLREDLRLGRIAIPKDPVMFDELTVMEYETPNGKITITPKEKIKSKLGRSPDKADALAYGNWVRARVPERTEVAAIPESDTTRDYRLERMLAQHAKQKKAEDRKLMKAMRAAGRKLL